MDQGQHPFQHSKELPPDAETQRSLRRGLLLAALGGVFVPCLYCWYSARVKSAEEAFIPGLMGLLAGFQTAAHFSKPNQKLPFPLGLNASLVLLWGTALWLGGSTLVRAAGWGRFSTLASLLLGTWGLGLALWGARESLAFLARSQVVEADQVELQFIPSLDPKIASAPVLAYRYLGAYRGNQADFRIRFQSRRISRALEEGRLQVLIRCLPEHPRVRRFLGWKIKR